MASAASDHLLASVALESTASISNSTELAEQIGYQLDNKLRSLRYGWFSIEEETRQQAKIEAETDFDPEILSRKKREFEEKIKNSREQEKLLAATLEAIHDLIEKKDAILVLSLAQFAPNVEEATRNRFTPSDLSELSDLYKRLKQNNPADPLFVTPRQELLIRVLFTDSDLFTVSSSFG